MCWYRWVLPLAALLTCSALARAGEGGKPKDQPGGVVDVVAPTEPGSLRFDVTCHRLSVRINGERRGLGPGQILDGVAPGWLRVEVSCPGHNDWADKIRVAPGENVRLRPRLKPVAGFLAVECNIDGAEVFIGQDRVGETPLIEPLVVRPGLHEIKVSKTGYPPYSSKVRIKLGKTRKLGVEMTAITGRLVVKTRPSLAVVHVDGEPVGETPVSVPLPIGPHDVRLTLEGYKTRTGAVEIKKGEPFEIDVTLKPRKGTKPLPQPALVPVARREPEPEPVAKAAREAEAEGEGTEPEPEPVAEAEPKAEPEPAREAEAREGGGSEPESEPGSDTAVAADDSGDDEPRAAPGVEPAPAPGTAADTADEDGETRWYEHWALWTSVGVVVVAAVAIPVALTVGGDEGPGSPSLGSRTLHLLEF